MIKIIHICWFGDKMPENIRTNLNRILAHNPGFELKIHNLKNININGHPFAEQALAEKRWAYLSDIVRLQALIEDGGWYLDTDVEMIHPFEKVKGPGDKLLLGYYVESLFGTAVIYSPPKHPYLQAILDSYRNMKPDTWPSNNLVFTDYFVNHVPGFMLTGKLWENEQCKVFPKEYFENFSLLRWRGFAVHHFCGSWRTGKNAPLGGKEIKTSYFTYRQNHVKGWYSRQKHLVYGREHNEFTHVYHAACRGERITHTGTFWR